MDITVIITNQFNQREKRKATVVDSIADLPAGYGHIGSYNGFSLWSDRSLKNIEYAKSLFAIEEGVQL